MSWSLKMKVICIILLIINLHLQSFLKDILEILIVIRQNQSTLILFSVQLATKLSVTVHSLYYDGFICTQVWVTYCVCFMMEPFIHSSLALHMDYCLTTNGLFKWEKHRFKRMSRNEWDMHKVWGRGKRWAFLRYRDNP